MEQEVRVCVYGATGYTGIELLRALSFHPYAKVVALTSQSYAGKRLSEVLPFFSSKPEGNLWLTKEPEEDFDLAFLCLPHEESLEVVPKLVRKGKKVIDLSGAYRIKKREVYEEYYGFNHPYRDLLEKAVYGLPELFRGEIKGANLVANPGCYPTATLLAVYPLLKAGVELEFLIVDALSGVSGAGRKTSQKFHYPEMEGDAFAYSVEKHRHTPEIEEIIHRVSGRHLSIRFTPQVIPAVRGMMVKVYARCNLPDFEELYRQTYYGEPFVFVVKDPPHLKHVIGTNLCFIYLYYHNDISLLEIISVIDNLGKGASLQAVQNFNLMMGFEEKTSLEMPALFP